MVIRGGMVVGGSGREPVVADVASADGRIVAVGKVASRGPQYAAIRIARVARHGRSTE